jgi:hypothetical protein
MTSQLWNGKFQSHVWNHQIDIGNFPAGDIGWRLPQVFLLWHKVRGLEHIFPCFEGEKQSLKPKLQLLMMIKSLSNHSVLQPSTMTNDVSISI